MAEELPRKLLDVASVWLAGGGPFGSGRLIVPGLVLTAGHTVHHPPDAPAASGWCVRLLAQRSADGTWRDAPYRAECIWRSEKVDLALLKIGDRTPRPACDPVFASLVEEIDGLEVTGYPQAKWDTERTARNYWLRGRLRIETVDWPFAFSVPMADVPKEVTKWEGMSGAVVIQPDPLGRVRVFGTVRHVEEMFANGKLYVERIATAFDDPVFCRVLKEALGEEPALVPVRAGRGPALPLTFDVLDSNAEVWNAFSLGRFSPHNPRVPFLGRQQELAALDAFLAEQKSPFAWWLITGGGGAGKTRLALRICRDAYRRGWQTGFLPDNSASLKSILASIDNWCPEVPTLIVADYVLKHITDFRTLTSRLAWRHDDLPPIRLLLLEREADERFDRQFLGSDQKDRGKIIGARHAAPISLTELTEADIWTLVEGCPWRSDGKRVALAQDEFFTRLGRLDKWRRVLVAMILADALAEAPERGGLGGLEDVLRELLRREREHLWPTELAVAGHRVGETGADVAIAFATMINGLGSEEFQTLKEKYYQAISPQILPFCALAIGKPFTRQRKKLERLEPDLIGEFFVLEALQRDPENPFAEFPHGWMPETAWRLRAGAMAEFVTRARQNFPDHDSIRQINITVSGVKESWLLAAFAIPFQANRLTKWFADVRQMLLAPAQSDIGAANAFADLTVLATSFESQVIELPFLAALLGDLAALARDHAEDAAVREPLARGLFNTLNAAKAEDDLARRDTLLEELRALARDRAEDAAVREPLARGLFNTLIAAKAEDDLARRDALLEELRALARDHAEDAAVREQLARGLFNTLIAAKAEDDLVRRGALLEKLRALARDHAEDAAVREQLARGLFNTLIAAKAEDDLARRDALLEELRALARDRAEDAAVREPLARGLFNTLNDAKAEDDLARRDALLEELRALARDHAEDAAVREPLARGLFNTLNDAKAEDDLARRDALLEELRALARDHAEDAAVREQLARGLFNTLIAAKAEDDLGRRDALLEELRALAAEYRSDSSVRAAFAYGLAEGDPVRYESLLEELRALSQAHPDDRAIHEALESALRNG